MLARLHAVTKVVRYDVHHAQMSPSLYTTHYTTAVHVLPRARRQRQGGVQ